MINSNSPTKSVRKGNMEEQKRPRGDGPESYINVVHEGITSVFLDDLPRDLNSVELYEYLKEMCGPLEKI